MEEVEVLAVDQQVEHVIALSTDLEASLYPIKLCQLEELSLLESAEQIALVLCLGSFVVQAVEDPTLKQLLVADTYFDGVTLRTVLLEPGADEGHVAGTSSAASTLVERLGCMI